MKLESSNFISIVSVYLRISSAAISAVPDSEYRAENMNSFKPSVVDSEN